MGSHNYFWKILHCKLSLKLIAPLLVQVYRQPASWFACCEANQQANPVPVLEFLKDEEQFSRVSRYKVAIPASPVPATQVLREVCGFQVPAFIWSIIL